MIDDSYHRSKYVSSGRFDDLDIVKIRWQAAKPPDGKGFPISVIAQAWGVSQEAIRRIVKRQSYSWVGTTQKGAPPEDPRIAKALETATLDAVGLNQRELDKIYAIQEARENPKADEGPNASLSEKVRREVEELAAGYGARKPAPRPSSQPSPQPVVEVAICGVMNEFGFECPLPKGHEGEHL
jgi:hypothetical protein